MKKFIFIIIAALIVSSCGVAVVDGADYYEVYPSTGYYYRYGYPYYYYGYYHYYPRTYHYRHVPPPPRKHHKVAPPPKPRGNARPSQSRPAPARLRGNDRAVAPGGGQPRPSGGSQARPAPRTQGSSSMRPSGGSPTRSGGSPARSSSSSRGRTR